MGLGLGLRGPDLGLGLDSEPCCAYTLQRASWLLPIVESSNDEEEEVDLFEGMCCANLRNLVWKLFEDPNSSKAARVNNE